ncbi:hypothetical protein QVD17_12842 [Tagetes erecta]|uniref:Uncharacterized protein n=1 Tax=Tagetes erecta TaxID=13708 RepID=A0AAD8KZW7_TARER|nr:hypothetical protein QVD17_12842 [Tagetes erecta]
MERTEPTFVPEWLKNNGSLTTASHQSSLHSDGKSLSKSLINKSLDNDLGRPATSSYFRRSSSSNGSTRLRSYSSFGRSRDRDWDKNKGKTETRHLDDSDSLANILPSWFEKDGVRRSHSNVSAKRADSWPRKLAAEKTGNKNGKIPFERDFPSLGAEEKRVDSEVRRVPSPVGYSGVNGGDVWTSALAEVPMMTNVPTSISATANLNVATGRNMAETLAQGHSRTQTAPQLSVGTQRLEELAVKQSRQLIPVTPSMPKSSPLNSSDKLKLKVGGQLQLQNSHTLSPRPVSGNADVTKTSSPSSKLLVLKPSRERNITLSSPKESSSPTSGGKLPNSPLAVPLDRKPSVSSSLEKKPSPQAKSRNDFFNLMRKKSMASNSSSPVSPDTRSTNVTPDASGTQLCGDNKVDLSCNAKLYSEEEEARFLRSLGWEETTEEEGLTEEEINSFYRDVSKYVNSKTAWNFFRGTQPKCLMPLNLQMGKSGDISHDTKVDS